MHEAHIIALSQLFRPTCPCPYHVQAWCSWDLDCTFTGSFLTLIATCGPTSPATCTPPSPCRAQHWHRRSWAARHRWPAGGWVACRQTANPGLHNVADMCKRMVVKVYQVWTKKTSCPWNLAYGSWETSGSQCCPCTCGSWIHFPARGSLGPSPPALWACTTRGSLATLGSMNRKWSNTSGCVNSSDEAHENIVLVHTYITGTRVPQGSRLDEAPLALLIEHLQNDDPCPWHQREKQDQRANRPPAFWREKGAVRAGMGGQS